MAKTEAEVFFYTQADRLADKEMQTVAQTLASMNAKACFKTLANIVAVVKQDKLLSLEAKVLVGSLAETEMQRLGQTLTDLEAKALVDTVRDNS